MSYITIPPIVSVGEPVLITIVTPNPQPINADIFLPSGVNVILSGFNQTIAGDLNTYEIYFTPTRAGTHHFRYQTYEEGILQAYFEAVSSPTGGPTILNYPSTVRQMQAFNWSVEFGKPGETITVIENGPVNITRSAVMEVRGYNIGYNNFTSQFEYAGSYTVTCNFSRSSSVSTSITVTPKIYLIYPSSVVATEGYSYSISGGNPNESWSGIVNGPASFNISGVLDGNGNGSYSGSVPSAGSYIIDFTFSQSGKYKHSLTAVPSTRNGIHGFGLPIAFSEIHAEFLVGYDLDTYRNRGWYLSLDNPSWAYYNQGVGNFSNYDLSFYQFYDKKAIDPVIPGQLYYGNPGYYEWAVPANRNGIVIEGWGAGGGTNNGPWGENTVISAGNYYMVAGGGQTAGAGGRRYGAPPGGGGTASGGDVNINGEGGSWSSAYGNGGRGGNSPNGGEGGAPRGVNQGNNPGNAPGGGASGVSGRDYSKSPAFGFSSGGGAGAYTAATVRLQRGNVITFNIGNGYSGGAPGAVRLTWS